MGVRPNFDPAHLYFITTTAASHRPIFQRDVVKHILVDSMNYMRVSGWINLYAFVIMPNHIHLITRFLSDHQISDVMREFKKHTSKQIIRQFQAEDNQSALTMLRKAANDIPGQEFKVWEHGYDARDIFSPDFLQQKLDYIHFNPCRPQWKLVEQPEDYPWSSARYYYAGKTAIINIDDVRELFA